MKRPKGQRYERYSFEDSPWAQDLTQRDLANLLGTTKDRLEALVRDKEKWIKRETKDIGGKLRNLALPVGRLRTIHERLKYHLNKIKQPDYLFSPRKGRSQRDNAEHHVGQNQFLSLDIKQFYPSTTSEHIFRWCHHVAGLRADVAGLLTRLIAIDDKMPFGSPISPVLTTLVHRAMFDEIYAACLEDGLKASLWVDDLVVSGCFVQRDLLMKVRSIIRQNGFQTHKIKFRSGGRPVMITGVPVERTRVAAPMSLHTRIKNAYAGLRANISDVERAQAMERLLSALGTYRYHLGPASQEGRITSNRMHALRQRRVGLTLSVTTLPTSPLSLEAGLTGNDSDTDLPWD